MSKKQNSVKKVNNKKNRVLVAHQEIFSGPLPHPEILKKYEEVVPGTGKVIVETFEKQARHRMSVENVVIASDIKNETLGIFIAGGMGFSGFFLAGFALYLDRDITALTILISELTVFAGIFIYGKNENRKERENKEKMVQERN